MHPSPTTANTLVTLSLSTTIDGSCSIDSRETPKPASSKELVACANKSFKLHCCRLFPKRREAYDISLSLDQRRIRLSNRGAAPLTISMSDRRVSGQPESRHERSESECDRTSPDNQSNDNGCIGMAQGML
jgi:hypothetical protein